MLAGVTEWWRSFFDEAYADAGIASVDARTTTRAVELLWRALALRTGARCLDQCSGIGRLALPLARRGVHVVAVDASPAYTARAAAAARAEALPVEAVCRDARSHVASPPCDGAFSWYSSLGYGEPHDDDAMLRCAHDSLRPGGRFACDFLNLPRVLRDLEAARDGSRLRRAAGRVRARLTADRYPHEADGRLTVQAAEHEEATGILRTTWTLRHHDGRRETRESRLRAYAPEALVARVAAAGLVVEAVLGSTRGEPRTARSPRCIVLARRPP